MDNIFYNYIFEKVNELLEVIGTKPIKEEELTPEILIELDPLGIIAETFKTILENFNEKNQELKLLNDKLNILFNSIYDGIYVINEDYEIVMINDIELKFLNMKREQLIGKKCYEVLAKQKNICKQCKIPLVKIKKIPIILHHTNLCEIKIRPTSKRELVDLFFYPYKEGEYIIYIRDLTEINRSLKNIQVEQKKLLVTLHSMAEGVLLLDENFKIILKNPSMEDILEINKNSTILTTFLQELQEKFQDVYSEKKVINIYDFKFKDKILEMSLAPILSNGKFQGIVIICRDITEHKKIEEEFIKMEKLETIGFLAGGIAHDFNNILTAALGNIELCELFIDSKEKLIEKLKLLKKSIYRAKSLTNKLLTFSTGGNPVTEIIDITQIIKDSLEFTTSGSSVQISYEFQDNLWQTEVDPNLISQVLSNLTLNAIQAMQDDVAGEISIKVENAIYKGKKYVKIIFKDNGKGIPEEILPKIFDPFFTTDKSHSGLGLAIVYNIIKKHKGKITVKSEIGKGTEFEILLPAVIGNLEETIYLKKNEKERKNPSKKTILIMDDEKDLRQTTKEMLEMHDYIVFEARNGEEAIDIYKNENIDIVILDLTIVGGMGGKETLIKLKEIDPNVKAIVASGYCNDPILNEYKKFGFVARLEKPFLFKELLEVINSIL